MATKTALRTGSLLTATVLLLPLESPPRRAWARGRRTRSSRRRLARARSATDCSPASATGATTRQLRRQPRLPDRRNEDARQRHDAGARYPVVVAVQPRLGRSADQCGDRRRTAGAVQLAKEKLTITPARPLYKYLPFTVRVVYTADRSQNPVSPGLDLPPGVPNPFTVWNETPDGFGVMGQPNRAHLVFPSNDHPSDKAQYTLRITTPNDRTGSPAAACKRSTGTAPPRPGSTGPPTRSRPMSSRSRSASSARSSRPGRTGCPSAATSAWRRSRARTTPTRCRPTPCRRRSNSPGWSSRSADRSRTSSTAYSASPARTTESRSRRPGSRPSDSHSRCHAKDEAGTLVHEMTHQYFGDAVSVRSWDDMWISEGHARYYERKYDASRGFIDLNRELKDLYEADQESRSQAGPMGHLNNQLGVLFDTDVPGQLMLTGLTPSSAIPPSAGSSRPSSTATAIATPVRRTTSTSRTRSADATSRSTSTPGSTARPRRRCQATRTGTAPLRKRH